MIWLADVVMSGPIYPMVMLVRGACGLENGLAMIAWHRIVS